MSDETCYCSRSKGARSRVLFEFPTRRSSRASSAGFLSGCRCREDPKTGCSSCQRTLGSPQQLPPPFISTLAIALLNSFERKTANQFGRWLRLVSRLRYAENQLTSPKMETRELYKITQEFPFTDRAELTIAINEFEAGLDFVASRHEIREGRHTDSGGENRRFWRVMFYESVERLPVRSHSSSVKPNAPKEAFRLRWRCRETRQRSVSAW